MKHLVLMRGVPGSGKSTAARRIAFQALQSGLVTTVAICSTDNYFMQDGEYIFEREKLGHNHGLNQSQVRQHMTYGIGLIVVDNTNIKLKEMSPYLNTADALGYTTEEFIVGQENLLPSMDTRPDIFEDYIDLCFKRNTHGVPREVIDRMARSFEWRK